MRLRWRIVVGALTVVTVACSSGGDDDAEGTTTTAPTSSTAPVEETTTTAALAEGTLDTVNVSTLEVAELDEPIAMAVRPGSPDLYVAEKAGRIRLIKVTERDGTDQVTYQLQNTPLLDISDDVLDDGEQGFLGMVFSTDGRKIYVSYSNRGDGAGHVVEYELGDGASIDARSARELLVVEQPFANHNGGHLAIGPDGYLYVGLGDGGSGGDPAGNGQDPSTLLGSILRIDPEQPDLEGPPYAIPAGNPFDGEDGRAEIWLYGVRNPWRFSFDHSTGDLWVADVGQNAFEEINRLSADGGFDAGRGANLGWNEMEATHPFDGGENPDGAVLPIFEYGRDDGCSVTGGYVYRGEEIPGLVGTYLYADLCVPGLRGLQLDSGTVIDTRTWDLPVEQAYSFGQDDDGELYVLLGSGPVLKLIPG
ncbi:MAG: PQQ-dependent sugar dehydrogenase [Acidimicrobiales bacterium]